MLDRKTAPAAHLLQDLSLTPVTVSSLKNGIKLHSFVDGTNPVLKIDIVFPFGKKHESKPGVSTVCARLMSEASLSYPSEELQETLDQYGAHLDISTDFDDTTFSLLCLAEHFSILLPLLKSIITEPLLDSAELEKIKLKLVQKLRVNNSKNGVIASKKLREELLSGSPYARYASEDSIRDIDVEDIQQFYHAMYGYKPELILAGDISDADMEQLNVHLGIIDYQDFSKEVDVSSEAYPGIHTVNREGSVQASIRLGVKSIPKQHPDYYHLSIANEILGGYFGSRLMKNIREDKGYTYGIYSSLLNYEQENIQVIGADVQIDNVDLAIEECKKELDLLCNELVSDNELETVKNYLLGKLATNLDNIFSQADNYKTNLSNEVNFHDFCDGFVTAIRNVTSQDILKISKKYFSQEYVVIKVV